MTERDIFLGVFDIPDPADRAAFLKRVCGEDVSLLGRIEALLRSHETAGSFLGSPAFAFEELSASEQVGIDGASPRGDHANTGETDLAFLSPSERTDSLGRLGHYEVLEVLGRGAFGIVFRAFDEVLERVVAVKVLAPHLAATSPARKRFLREARSSARVRHQNVVQVYAVEERPLPYLVMEFIPGESLQERIDRAGPLEAPEVALIGRQVAEGLAAAHATGLVHRDIKPANILLEAGPDPSVKITDFGLAQAIDDANPSQSEVVAGTPIFMSPEQVLGERIDERSDLFSLGSVVYAMCTGRPPFRGGNPLAVMQRVASSSPRPIPEIIPEVPAWLCDVIARLHARRREDRYSSAREVADVLGRCLDEPPHSGVVAPQGVQGNSPGAASTSASARRWLWPLYVVLLMALLGLAVSEASGVSDMSGTVVRLFSPHGTLVVEVDDPGLGVTIDGEELVITGAGPREIRLKPGMHTVKTTREGKTLGEVFVAVERNKKPVVRVSRISRSQGEGNQGGRAEPPSTDSAQWERWVGDQPAQAQVEAVAARLKLLNPGFDGVVTPTLENGIVTGLQFSSGEVTDISPVRAFRRLKSLACQGSGGDAKLADLSPLRGMQLTTLICNNTRIADLTPLQGMRLTELAVHHTRVADLKPLTEMPLAHLNCSHTAVEDLSPLKGKKLITLYLDDTRVADLSPLRGMPLKILNFRKYPVRRERDGPILRSLERLESINSEEASAFLKTLDTAKRPSPK